MLATRRACEKFRGIPVSISEFRRRHALHRGQARAPGRQLPPPAAPKAGGVAFVLEAMGDALHAVLDVTIAYPAGTPTMLDLLAGRIPEVVIEVRELPIPAETSAAATSRTAPRACATSAGSTRSGRTRTPPGAHPVPAAPPGSAGLELDAGHHRAHLRRFLLAFRSQKLLLGMLFWPPRSRSSGEYQRLLTYGWCMRTSPTVVQHVHAVFLRHARRALLPGAHGPLRLRLLLHAGLLVSILPTWWRHRHDPEYRSLGAPAR
jgi:hypothetical protein